MTPEEILLVQAKVQAADRKSAVLKRRNRSRSSSRRERSKARMKRLQKLTYVDNNKTERSVNARTAVSLSSRVTSKVERFNNKMSQDRALADVTEQSDTGSAISGFRTQVYSTVSKNHPTYRYNAIISVTD